MAVLVSFCVGWETVDLGAGEEGRLVLKLSKRADREGALARSRLRTKLANLPAKKRGRPRPDRP